jgi:hypothetical protein
MALFHRIKVTTATTGTGALTLGSTGVRDATNGDCLAPAEIASSIGNRIVTYWITSGANWAYGNGLVSTDGLTLTRDANERSWNGSAFAVGLLSLSGTSTVFVAPRAADMGAGRRGRDLAYARGAFLG